MNCYIKIENGQAVGHPALEENLLDVHGGIPAGWERLTLVDPGTLPFHPLKQYDPEPTYELVDGVWTQIWKQSDCPEEVINKYIEKKYETLLNTPYGDNFVGWVFNRTTAKFEAPIPKPIGGNYRWHGPSNAWKEAPLKPTDGKNYRFNFYTWEWVEEV